MAKRKPPRRAKKQARKPRQRAARKKAPKTRKRAEPLVWLVALLVGLPLTLLTIFVYVLGWKLGYWGLEAWPPFVFGVLVLGFLASRWIVNLLTAKTREKALK